MQVFSIQVSVSSHMCIGGIYLSLCTHEHIPCNSHSDQDVEDFPNLRVPLCLYPISNPPSPKEITAILTSYQKVTLN